MGEKKRVGQEMHHRGTAARAGAWGLSSVRLGEGGTGKDFGGTSVQI